MKTRTDVVNETLLDVIQDQLFTLANIEFKRELTQEEKTRKRQLESSLVEKRRAVTDALRRQP